LVSLMARKAEREREQYGGDVVPGIACVYAIFNQQNITGSQVTEAYVTKEERGTNCDNAEYFYPSFSFVIIFF
jgi:hypothetical protein